MVNPAYAEIIVVRHGETEWNVDGRIQVLVLFFFWEFETASVIEIWFYSICKCLSPSYNLSEIDRCMKGGMCVLDD